MCSVLGVIDFNNVVDNMRQFFSNEEYRRKICITNHAMFICRCGGDTDRKFGTMPFVFNGRLYAVACMGELSNADYIRKELNAQGVELLSGGIDEIIIASYSIFGKNCAERLRGSFVCSVYDEHRENLFLMRSPGSEKEMYYTVCGGMAMFSTEYEDVKKYIDGKVFCGQRSTICSVAKKEYVTFDKSGIITKKDD